MCGELRDRLGLQDAVTVLLCDRLRWYSHVLRKMIMGEEIMNFVVEGVSPRVSPKRTRKEVVEWDMKNLKLSKEDVLETTD